MGGRGSLNGSVAVLLAGRPGSIPGSDVAFLWDEILSPGCEPTVIFAFPQDPGKNPDLKKICLSWKEPGYKSENHRMYKVPSLSLIPRANPCIFLVQKFV